MGELAATICFSALGGPLHSGGGMRPSLIKISDPPTIIEPELILSTG
jgi:hypothetical protein